MSQFRLSLKRSPGTVAWQALDYLILALLLAGVALFILYPIISVVTTSFFDKGVFTLRFYRELFSPQNFQLIKNSLLVATLSSGLTTFFALGIGLYLFTAKGRKRAVIQNSLLLTMVSPPFVSALAFIMLFGRRGLITHGLLGLSVNFYGWQSIVILQTITNISFATLLLISSLDAIDARQLMASADLGAKPRQTLWRMILPAAWPGIVSVLFILFTLNLADFGTPIIVGGRFKVLATEAYLQVISTANLGKAAAISMLMLPPAVIAFFFYRKAMGRTASADTGSKSLRDSGYNFQHAPSVRVLLVFMVALFFAVMILKYGNIFLSAFSNYSSGSLSFTTRYFGDLPRSQWNSFQHSIVYSLIAGAGASILGILLAYYTHRRKLPGMKAMEFCASLPYIIPGTFFGLGYVAAFSSGPLTLRGTAAIIILNYTFRQLSVANKAANAAFSAIDENQERAARDLGASNIQIFGNILLPQLLPTFLTCFITVFTSSMTAVGAIIFLISPGKNVASVELFQSVSNGRYGVAAVQALFIILVTVGINLVSMYWLNRTMRRGEVKDVPAAG